MPRRPYPDQLAVTRQAEDPSNTEVRHVENLRRLDAIDSGIAQAATQSRHNADLVTLNADRVAAELKTHTAQDDVRFTALTAAITSVSQDIKSLLASRIFNQAVWRTIIATAIVVSTIAGLIVAWLRH
jgi:hypothetical protein